MSRASLDVPLYFRLRSDRQAKFWCMNYRIAEERRRRGGAGDRGGTANTNVHPSPSDFAPRRRHSRRMPAPGCRLCFRAARGPARPPLAIAAPSARFAFSRFATLARLDRDLTKRENANVQNVKQSSSTKTSPRPRPEPGPGPAAMPAARQAASSYSESFGEWKIAVI